MIICCGEALIDMLPRQLPDGSDVFLPVPGGAVFNTAIALGRLGENAGFISGLSTDMFGEQLLAFLKDSGVDTDLAIRSAKPTTLAFVKLTDGHAEYSFVDENTAGRMIDPDSIPAVPSGVEALHFGAISLISEPCGSAYEELHRRNGDRVVISLDPNIRPGFVHDERPYRDRLARMIVTSDIVKVSGEDLEWLEPGTDFETVAKNWIADGVSIVVLTMGGDGARAITRSDDVTVPGLSVEVVDTVGAGDTFNAGLLASLRAAGVLSKFGLASLDRETLTSALSFASRVAAVTVSRAGANPPWRDELQ